MALRGEANTGDNGEVRGTYQCCESAIPCSLLLSLVIQSVQLLQLSLVLSMAGVRFTVVKCGDAKPTVHTFN